MQFSLWTFCYRLEGNRCSVLLQRLCCVYSAEGYEWCVAMDEFPLPNLCTVTQSLCSCEVTKVSKKQAWLSHRILNFRAGCIGRQRLLALYHIHTLLTKSSTNHRGNNRCGCVSLLYRKSWLEISGQNESLLLIEKSPEAAVSHSDL